MCKDAKKVYLLGRDAFFYIQSVKNRYLYKCLSKKGNDFLCKLLQISHKKLEKHLVGLLILSTFAIANALK